MKNWILGDERNIKKISVIWNALGGALSAGQAAIILIFISHRLGIVMAGIVTIAYAIATLFLSMGRYGVRNYQVTDVNQEFSFADYFYSRIIVIAAVVLILFIYLFLGFHLLDYSIEKIVVIFEVTVLKLIDALEDVYLGRYQQIGRLDVGAKIMAVRLFFSTAAICIFVLAGSGIHIALLGGMAVSILLDICLLKGTVHISDIAYGKIRKKNIWNLLKVCFPLCVGTTLSIYIGNVPKYMIDAYMNEKVQAIFGYIMMPVFAIMLLNNFIYQPIVKDLGVLWEKRNIKAFKKSIWKQCGIVVGLTVLIMAAGILIGLPVLSLLYNADLTIYKAEFSVLLLGGGFYALAYYLNVPITTIRRHNYIAVGYAIAAVLAVICGKYFVVSMGMMGAAVLYLGINILLVVIYLLVLIFGIKNDTIKSAD